MPNTMTAQSDAIKMPAASTRREIPSGRVSIFVVLFILGLMIPIQMHVGSARISPYRIILLLMLFPCLIQLISGKAGKVLPTDILFFLHALWATISLSVVHGFGNMIETFTIYIVEFLGPYLLARCYIRTSQQFETVVRIYFYILLFLLPFVLLESLTGINIIMEILATGNIGIGERMGLIRSHGPFEHPILYGVFVASVFTLFYYVTRYKASFIKAGLASSVSMFCTFFSLSSGALLGLVLQIAFIGWDIVTRRIAFRWYILLGIVVAMYIFIDIVSTRSPFHVFVTYLTFSTGSSYNRILIWIYGTAEVWRHPIFGIGLNDWVRAPWMSNSMDNFWLLVTVRFGLPAFLFYIAGMLIMIFKLSGKKFRSLKLQTYRKAWIISIVSFAIMACTVHLWNASFCHFMFLLGASAWLLDTKEDSDEH